MTRYVQPGARINRSGARFPLCEVNPQTPISKRGGVRGLLLNLCREAVDGGGRRKGANRRTEATSDVSRADVFLGIGHVGESMCPAQICVWISRPGTEGSKSNARYQSPGTKAWCNSRNRRWVNLERGTSLGLSRVLCSEEDASAILRVARNGAAVGMSSSPMVNNLRDLRSLSGCLSAIQGDHIRNSAYVMLSWRRGVVASHHAYIEHTEPAKNHIEKAVTFGI